MPTCNGCAYVGLPSLCIFCYNKENKMIDLKELEGALADISFNCENCGKETSILEEILINNEWVDCCVACKKELE